MSSENIASIYVGVELDTRSLQKQLQELEKQKLTIDVDDSALTDLNKHFDLKLKHHKELQNFFKQNPLTVHVDDSQLTDLNKKLEAFQKSTTNNQIKLEVSFDDNQAEKAFAQFEAKIVKITEGLVKAVAAPFGSIGQGLFEGIGQGFGRQISSGLSKSLKEKTNFNLSSFINTQANKGLDNLGFTRPRNKTNASSETSTTASAKTKTNSSAPNANPEVKFEYGNIRQPEAVGITNEQLKSIRKITASALNKNIGGMVNETFKLVQNQVAQNKINIGEANAEFAKVRAGFSTAYATLKQTLTSGNIRLAQVQAETITKAAADARRHIDDIQAKLKASGAKTSFGSELSTAVGSTKGVIEARYAKPAKRIQGQLAEQASFETVGKQVVAGTAAGLSSKSPALRQASLLALSILNQMRRDLGIKSPSRKAIEIMKYVVQGLVLGAKNGARAVTDALNPITSAVTGKLGSMASSASRTARQSARNVSESAKRFQQSAITPRTNEFFRNIGLSGSSFAERRQYVERQRAEENIAGSEAYFEKLYKRFQTRAIRGAQKTYGTKEGAGVAREAGAAVFSATAMLQPGLVGAAAIAPLAQSLLPSATVFMLIKNLFAPIAPAIENAIKSIAPVRQRLNVLAGSVQGGSSEFDYIQETASRNNISAQVGVDAYSKLAFAAKDTKLEGQGVKELYEGIALATRTMGLGAGETSLIFQAFTQMMAKGKISMEELRQQLGEKFPPAMQVFAKAMSVSVPEMQALVSKGAVLSEDILPKVAAVLKQDFGEVKFADKFLVATTSMENASFGLSVKLSDTFNGIFAALTNITTAAINVLTASFDTIALLGGALLLGMGIQVAVAMQAILDSSMVAGYSKIIQNFFFVTIKKAAGAITPFMIASLIDVAANLLGAEMSVFDNMAQGVTQSVISMLWGIDSIVSDFTGKGVFSIGFKFEDMGVVQQVAEIFTQITSSTQGFFSIIPSGLLELGALFMMFEQVQLLGKMFIIPTFQALASNLGTLAKSYAAAIFNTRNFKDALKSIVPTALNAAKSVVFASGELLLALGVMALARSDFSNPIADGFRNTSLSIVSNVKEIESALASLEPASEKVGKNLTSNLDLKSKGLELNPGKILGVSNDSFKSDDLLKWINQGGRKDKALSDAEKQQASKTKSEADNLGVGSYFSADDRYITLAQERVLNNAKEIKQFTDALGKELAKAQLTPETIKNFGNTPGQQQAIKEITAIDSKIKQLTDKRVTLGLQNDSASKKELRVVDKEIDNLLETRKGKAKYFEVIFGNVEDNKKLVDEAIKNIESSDLPAQAKKALKAPLEETKTEIEAVLKAIDTQGLAALIKPLEDVWVGVVDKIRDAEVAYEKFSKQIRLNAVNNQTAILQNAQRTNQSEATTSRQLNVSSLQTNAQNLQTQEQLVAFREASLRQLLGVPGADINQVRKKEIDDLRNEIEKDKQSVADLGLQVAQSRSNLIKEMNSLTKQVSDYYINIEKQSKETALEIEKINLETKNQQIRNQLRETLVGGYETIIGTLVSGIEEALDSFGSVADKAIESQSQLLTTSYGIRDATRAGVDLSRQIPDIKVGLDFSSIPSDTNVAALADEIDTAVGGTETLGTSIESSTSKIDDLYTALTQTIEPILEQARKVDDVKQKIDEANTATQTTTQTTQNWNAALTPVNDNILTINSSFGLLFSSLGNITTQTNNWLLQLSNAPNLLGKIGDTINSFFGQNSTGNGSSSGFVSPLKGKSLDDLINYQESHGQGFYGMRDGGKRQHSKIDFDSRVGGGQGAEVLAAIEGVATARLITPISAGVNIEGKDSKGNNITIVYNHLASPEIIKKFNTGKGFAPKQVQAGERLSTVTMDGLSTGPHLDFGIKVNGKYVDPQQWLATEGKAMAAMQKQINVAATTGNQSSGGISRGGNLLNESEASRLTAKGRDLYKYQQNPNVLAFADVVARAEGTDFRGNSKNFGYGMLIGGSQTTDFSQHPFVNNSGQSTRRPIANSTAGGRYQMMNFNYSKNKAQEQFGRGAQSDMASIFEGETPGSFSPAVQDLYFIASLKQRGILDEVLNGDFESALKNPQIAMHYASLQAGSKKSFYGGQGTPEGSLAQTLPFAKQRLAARSSQPVIAQANANTSATLPQLQATANQATQIAIKNQQVKSVAQQASIAEQTQKAQIAGETALNKIRRQTEKTVRESQDSSKSRNQSLTDARYSSLVNATPQEQAAKASTDILRQKTDTIRDYTRAYDDAQRTVSEANKLIINSESLIASETDANRRRVLTTGITEAKKTRDAKIAEATDLKLKINQISEAFDKQEYSRVIKFNREAIDLAKTKQRALEDAQFAATVNPSANQQNARNKLELDRKRQDELLRYQRQFEDARFVYSQTTSEKVRKVKLQEMQSTKAYLEQLETAYKGQESAREIRARREKEDADRAEARLDTDRKFDAIPFPSKSQEAAKKSTDIQRSREDALVSLERSLEDARRELTSITSNQLKVVKLAEIKELETKIQSITKTFSAQEKARFDKAAFEEYVRASKAGIEQQENENRLIEEKINSLEKIKELYPTDTRLAEIPGLQASLKLNQLQVAAAKELLDIEEAIKRSGDDSKVVTEQEARLKLLEAQNDEKLKQLNLEKQISDEQIRRAKLERELNIKSRFNELGTQLTENQVNKAQKTSQRDAFGLDTGDLEKARYENYQSQVDAAQLDLQKTLMELDDFSKQNGLTTEQVHDLTESIYQLNEIKLTELSSQFDQLIKQDTISELEKVRQNLERQYDLFNKPANDLKLAQVGSYQQRGGNQFVANKVRRDIATEDEFAAREQALINLDVQIANARESGIEVLDADINSMRENIVALSGLRLSGLTEDFKSISSSLDDVAKQGLATLSQGLTDVIVKGGDLGATFDNLFESVLNSVINMGLNSLLGGIGLFYKGQIPNYASGGIHSQTIQSAMLKERAMSGRKPQLAVVHENELIIPASRAEELASLGFSPEMLLGRIDNYANGSLPKNVRMANRDGNSNAITVKSEVINKKEYVDSEQLHYAMQEAAKRGAEQGSLKVQMQLQNSTAYRSSVGL